MDNEKLISGVRSAHANPNYIKNKAEYVEYYRDTYGKNWTSKAAEKLSGTTDKKSLEYKRAIRQFQGERINQAGTRLAPKFEAVGKELPPSSYTPKSDTFKVTVHGTQAGGEYRRNAKGENRWVSTGTRDRTFTATFSGPDAYQFVNNPTLGDVLRGMGYPDDVIDRLSEEGDDSASILSITSVS